MAGFKGNELRAALAAHAITHPETLDAVMRRIEPFGRFINDNRLRFGPEDNSELARILEAAATLTNGSICYAEFFELEDPLHQPAWMSAERYRAVVQSAISDMAVGPTSPAQVTSEMVFQVHTRIWSSTNGDAIAHLKRRIQAGIKGSFYDDFNRGIREFLTFDLTTTMDASMATHLSKAPLKELWQHFWMYLRLCLSTSLGDLLTLWLGAEAIGVEEDILTHLRSLVDFAGEGYVIIGVAANRPNTVLVACA